MKPTFLFLTFITLFLSQDIYKFHLDKAIRLQAEFKNKQALAVYTSILKKDSTHLTPLIQSSILLCEIGFSFDDDELKKILVENSCEKKI